ncbi:MAG: long-chain-fatty-acid--CoA ligase [Pseudomonadota bacterium]
MPMQGLMMDTPLIITDILKHGLRTYPDQEIVTRLVEGGTHRYTFKDAGARIAKLANALTRMGLTKGDRVAVMGWNTHRQLELYYAISGIGAICHTINPRLGPENAGFVMNHAEDKALFFDATFAPLAEGLAPHVPSIEHYIAMTPKDGGVQIGGQAVRTYEELIAKESDQFEWPQLEEEMAATLCYTSGTTGQPKGVLYSHRSTVLHTIVTALPTSLGINPHDVVLPVVPMFHVNAWGVPYSMMLLGFKVVFPGPGMDGASLYEQIEGEGVTYSLGVPTVWLNLLQHVEENNLSFSTMKYTLVGGAALNRRVIEGFEALGVKSRQGWGMTEMSPTGTVNFEEDGFFDLPKEERIEKQLRQGKALPLIDMRIVSEKGEPLPHDGGHEGHLHVRGPWVLSSYYRHPEATLTDDGWFDTGDVSIIHPDGRMQITDRAKDVIKSGGEWISTIDIENAALSHPAVIQAAAIGVPHPKWLERPLLIVQLAPGQDVPASEILEFVKEKLDKLSWPDDVQIVDEIPIGATGKVLKTKLREQFKDYVLPGLKVSAAGDVKKPSIFGRLFGKGQKKD